MPELPEVETVKRGLSGLVLGKQIMSVSTDWPKSFPNDQAMVDEFMLGAQILGVRRRGKALMIDLSTRYTLVIHLKMTGQLVYVDEGERFGAGHPSDSLITRLPDNSTRVIVTFMDGSALYFNDQRKFGWVRLIPTLEIESMSFFAKLGPEPLEGMTTEDFIKRIRRRLNTSVKAALLDQTVIAGVGNIYADESLFAAGIHPARFVRQLNNTQLSRLFDELRAVLKLSIEKGGSTDKNYVDAKGQKGSYLTFARVFRREGQTCPIDGSIIIKTRVAGRGTHYCPICQKPPRGLA